MTKSERIAKDAESINYKSIGAMLCGKVLTKEQMADVDKYNKNFDEAREQHSRRSDVKRNSWKH